jgi:GT2 family glycosyltransferase
MLSYNVISGSIVLYNSGIEQLECVINSFAPSEKRQLFLIDNSPLQTNVGSILRDNKYISYYFVGRNLGYGTGHNIALKMALKIQSQYHLIMNPDVQYNPQIIDTIIEFMENDESIIYLMPKILNKKKELQYLCKLLPTPANLILRRFLPEVISAQKINDGYIIRDIEYDSILNPPSLSGCFMFLRMSLIEKYNLFFDERFFMYCEDVDLIRRLHRIGKTIYYPQVSIIHDHSKESYRLNRMFFEHIKSAVKYFNKYGWFYDKERKEMNRKFLEEIKKI